MGRKMRGVGPHYVDIFSKDTRMGKFYEQTLHRFQNYKELTDLAMGEIWQSKHADIEIQDIIKDFYRNTNWSDDIVGLSPTNETLLPEENPNESISK